MEALGTEVEDVKFGSKRCRGSDEEDESDDDEIPKKPVPDWARGQALHSQILAQFRVDPDEIFHYHEESCNLDDVFAGNSESPLTPYESFPTDLLHGAWAAGVKGRSVM